MKTVLTTAALIASLIASAGVATAAPIMDNCADELVRCSPKASPRTVAGGWQGGLGWQVAVPHGTHGERTWYDR